MNKWASDESGFLENERSPWSALGNYYADFFVSRYVK